MSLDKNVLLVEIKTEGEFLLFHFCKNWQKASKNKKVVSQTFLYEKLREKYSIQEENIIF
jgi:hypothetical protein